MACSSLRRGLPAVLALLPLVAGSLAAQQLPWQKSALPTLQKEPVEYVYPEQVQLQPGQPREVDLHFRIREGLHINSHVPSDKNFIRTELIVVEPPGVEVESVTFPPGTEYASKAFPGQKLSVYTGEVILHAKILAGRKTASGSHLLNAALRYQACDIDTCMPPKKAPVALDLVVP